MPITVSPTPSPITQQQPIQAPQLDQSYLQKLAAIISQFSGLNAFPSLPGDVMNSLSQMLAAEQGAAQQGFQTARDQLLTRLFGSGFNQSSVAVEQTQKQAENEGQVLAQILANAAQRQLGLQQSAGQFNLQGLLGQVNALGSAAGLATNNYQAMLQPYLQQQQFQQQSQLQQQQFGQQTYSQILDFLLKNGFAPGTTTTNLASKIGSVLPQSSFGSFQIPVLNSIFQNDPTFQQIQGVQNNMQLLTLQEQYRRMLQTLQNQNSPFGANTGANYGY